MSLRQFTEKEVLGSVSIKHRTTEAYKRFSHFFKDDTNLEWAAILSRFATDRPWTFWDATTVNSALHILETDLERTAHALNIRSTEFGIALDNLFHVSPATMADDPLDASKSRDILSLSVEFHPEYLRRTEHIFANLLCIYWSVLKRGGVEGKFDVRGAVALLESRSITGLLQGYDDRVRNGIAHGQIVFNGLGSIQYGDERGNYALTTGEFLKTFDELWRTIIGLTLGVLLFLARNEIEIRNIGVRFPASLMSFVASGILRRDSLSVLGAVESKTALAGKQLHLFVRTSMLTPEWVVFDCIRISAQLIRHGAIDYNRFIFDIDQGRKLSSQVITLPRMLSSLLDDPETPLGRFNEAVDGSPLLWYSESKLGLRLRTWREIWNSVSRSTWHDLQNQWESLGLRISNRSYRIIKVENKSTENVRRIHVYAVMRRQELVNDRDYVTRLIRTIIRRASKLRVENDTSLRQGRSAFGRPTYVWVSLYKVDGTFRWVSADGWFGGNLIATAEKVFGFRKKPILEKNPELIWKGIRFRFSIDSSAYAKAMDKVLNTLGEIGLRHGDDAQQD